jgi:hypothetical protein
MDTLSSGWGITRRMAVWGLIAGALLGGLYGTPLIPIAGTLYGGLLGGFIGLFLGLVDGLVVAVITSLFFRAMTRAAPEVRRYRIIIGAASVFVVVLVGLLSFWYAAPSWTKSPTSTQGIVFFVVIPALIAAAAAWWASGRLAKWLVFEADWPNSAERPGG